MAADVLVSQGIRVTVVERRPAPAWKLFVAGSSGLNITNNLPVAVFAQHYTPKQLPWHSWLERFSPLAWIRFIEGLGEETFLGTSGRYFVSTMNSARLVRAWRRRLTASGVQWVFGHELSGIARSPDNPNRWRIETRRIRVNDVEADAEPVVGDGPSELQCDGIVLALGGGSWEKTGPDPSWPELLSRLGLRTIPFAPANVGYQLQWKPQFLKECEGKPLKNVSLRTKRGERRGEVVVTSYGIEGTPVYFTGTRGLASVDLKPDLAREQLTDRIETVQKKHRLSPLRAVKKSRLLDEVALSLIFHHAPPESLLDATSLSEVIKSFPVELKDPQPLSEAISSCGGLAVDEIDENLMVRRMPRVHAIGEMLDWDAPTGGFLIQACVTQGFVAGHALAAELNAGHADARTSRD